jgi:hypothetical protein
MSIRKACVALGVSRSYYTYKPNPRDDSEVINALTELADKKPTWGFSNLSEFWRVPLSLKPKLINKSYNITGNSPILPRRKAVMDLFLQVLQLT